jgi:hypothetical protein
MAVDPWTAPAEISFLAARYARGALKRHDAERVAQLREAVPGFQRIWAAETAGMKSTPPAPAPHDP